MIAAAATWLTAATAVGVALGRSIRLADQRQPIPHLHLVRDEAPTSPPTARSGEEGRRRGPIALVR